MKTDRFTDLIRRKLESIRPEFQEKDWTRLQESLRQGGLSQPGPDGSAPVKPLSGGSWFSQPWLLAAASVSSVVLLAVSLWQRSEIHYLRETVSQLKQPTAPSTPPQVTPGTTRDDVASITPGEPILSQRNGPSGQSEALRETPNHDVAQPWQRSTAPSARPDTVYITRYVRVPARLPVEQPTPSVDQPSTNQSSELANRPNKQTRLPAEQLNPNTYDPTSTQNPVSEVNDRVTVGSAQPVSGRKARQSADLTADPNPNQALAQNQASTRKNTRSTRPASDSKVPRLNDSATYPDAGQNVTPSTSGTVESNDNRGTEPTRTANADYSLVTPRPLNLERVDWNVLLAQRAKRMRPTRPSVPTALAQAPASQPVKAFHVNGRVGVGADISGSVRSVGLAGELQLGTHWTIGLGLSSSTYVDDLFLTDYDFDERTKRNFRHEYAPSLDPKRDILNITRKVNRIQIPLSLGYRIPIGQSFSVLPSVGTYLNLSNQETITFYYREMPRIFTIPNFQPGRTQVFTEGSFKDDRPYNPMDSFTYALSLDWQRGHWTAQAGPLLTVPTQFVTTWNREASVGIRARVYYNF